MFRTILAVTSLLTATSAFAQDKDCIENIAGKVVCGSDADAVRARIRAEARYAENPDNPAKARRSGSVYNNFGQSLFVRGGYIFAAHSGGVSDQASAPMFAVGYRAPMSRFGRNRWNFETEVVYARDSEDIVLIPPTTLTLSGYAITGLASVRWEYDTRSAISPFISAGVGPTYARAKVSDGITEIADGEWAFGYSGRAGLEAHLSDRVSMEAGYRYLGATNSGTAGLHTGEVGLNLNF